ncbi:hypothetical protein PAXRUDRAFT_47826, partial [Paxillus rubicundulus Ve08.2h10]
KSSMINDEDLAVELNLHLQSIGKFIKAGNLIQYLAEPDVQQRFGLKKTISLATVKCWVHVLNYWWEHNHHGQYVDGHEHLDVINYQQNVFSPQWKELEGWMWHWSW